MKSKYSAAEIEILLDSIPNKISKNFIDQNCPTTFKMEHNPFDLYSANAIDYIVNQLIHFNITDADSFIQFVKNLDGYSLLTDAQKSKLDNLSEMFIGSFLTINNIKSNVDYPTGSFALIMQDGTGQPNFAIKSGDKWFWLNREAQEIKLNPNENVEIGLNLMSEFKVGKGYIYAAQDNNVSVDYYEFTVIKTGIYNQWAFVVQQYWSSNQPIIKVSQFDQHQTKPKVFITSLQPNTIKFRFDIIV